MNAWLLIVALQLQGTVWALRARRDLGVAFCAWAGLPLGLLAWVVLDLIALATPLPCSGPGLLGLYGAALVVGALLLARDAVRRRRLDAHEAAHSRPTEARALGLLATIVIGLAATAGFFSGFDFSVMTPDSLVMLDAGRAFAFYGEIVDGEVLSSRGMLSTMALGSSVFVGAPYLPALFPMLAVSLAGLFVTLGSRALRGGVASADALARSLALPMLAALALFAPYYMLIHVFYLHTNMAAASYLFGFASCFWLAEREQVKGWLPFAFIFLLGFSLTRVEAPMVALLMIAIAFGRARVDERMLMRCTHVFLVLLFGWQVVVWQAAEGRAALVGARQTAFMAGLVLAAIPGLALLRVQALRPIRSRLGLLAVLVLCAAIAVAAFLDGESLRQSVFMLVMNATAIEWGGLWLVMSALAVCAFVRPRVEGARVFAVSAAAYLLLIVLMSALRGIPYRLSWQDSGNRMLVHIAPLVMFWLLLVYAPGFAVKGEASRLRSFGGRRSSHHVSDREPDELAGQEPEPGRDR